MIRFAVLFTDGQANSIGMSELQKHLDGGAKIVGQYSFGSSILLILESLKKDNESKTA